MQSSPDLTLDDGTVSTVCDRCRETWERSKKEPPCSECRVELREENQEAANIYMTCRRQYITRIALTERGFPYSVIVDVSIPAVESAMRIEGVKNQKECMAKVRRVFHHFLNEADNEG